MRKEKYLYIYLFKDEVRKKKKRETYIGFHVIGLKVIGRQVIGLKVIGRQVIGLIVKGLNVFGLMLKGESRLRSGIDPVGAESQICNKILVYFVYREYAHSVAVYQKYLTRLGELIMFEPWRENYHFSQPS